tara:strand:+ start:3613 stop:5385 length:1773 start_codon:yes stop_codon:yes gene_type:complete
MKINNSYKKYEKKVSMHLHNIYSYLLNSKEVDDLTKKILKITLEKKNNSIKKRKKWSEKDSILICYPDFIKKKNTPSFDLLQNFLDKYLINKFSIIHLLPFYPSSSDEGFSVIDFFKVDNNYGTWKNIKKISKKFDIMADVVLNHSSTKNKWFLNFLQNKAEGKDFYYALDENIKLSHVVRARSHDLLQKFKTLQGDKYVWCTFSKDQVDFDFRNPKVLIKFIDVVMNMLKNGIRVFRFDAVAFIWKRTETNCINLDQVHAIVKLFRVILEEVDKNSLVLTETNLPFFQNISYFGNSDEAHIVYNFSLSPLIINTLIKENCVALQRWSMSMSPAKKNTAYLNFLATHDGIGIRPLEGILKNSDLKKLLVTLEKFGAKFTFRKNQSNKKSVYEANISLFDALSGTYKGKDIYKAERFLCAHTMMLAFEGIPAIYSNSLIATSNDYKLFKKTKLNRSLNRHRYSEKEINSKLNVKTTISHKIFNKLIKILDIRKKQKAFHPNATQYTLNLGSKIFGIWRQSIDKEQSIFAITNISSTRQILDLRKLNIIDNEKWFDVLGNITLSNEMKFVHLAPYVTTWITNYTKERNVKKL